MDEEGAADFDQPNPLPPSQINHLIVPQNALGEPEADCNASVTPHILCDICKSLCTAPRSFVDSSLSLDDDPSNPDELYIGLKPVARICSVRFESLSAGDPV